MYFQSRWSLKGETMSTPTVTEIPPHPEPVVHDTFIDDIPATPRPQPTPVRRPA
jgi:hypothetical protein